MIEEKWVVSILNPYTFIPTTIIPIVKYIKDSKGNKRGMMVATAQNNTGWSLCSKLDEFDKEKAFHIASDRAIRGCQTRVPYSIEIIFDKFKDRAKRYYRGRLYV